MLTIPYCFEFFSIWLQTLHGNFSTYFFLQYIFINIILNKLFFTKKSFISKNTVVSFMTQQDLSPKAKAQLSVQIFVTSFHVHYLNFNVYNVTPLHFYLNIVTSEKDTERKDQNVLFNIFCCPVFFWRILAKVLFVN